MKWFWERWVPMSTTKPRRSARYDTWASGNQNYSRCLYLQWKKHLKKCPPKKKKSQHPFSRPRQNSQPIDASIRKLWNPGQICGNHQPGHSLRTRQDTDARPRPQASTRERPKIFKFSLKVCLPFRCTRERRADHGLRPDSNTGLSLPVRPHPRIRRGHDNGEPQPSRVQWFQDFQFERRDLRRRDHSLSHRLEGQGEKPKGQTARNPNSETN